MQTDYTPFVDRMINKYEGGYGWDKNDPGGPTKYGVTCFDLAEHRGQRMTSMEVWAPIVHDMTLAEAEAIYSTKYATAIDFTDLPAGIDCVMMDYGVNSGIGRANRVARALTKSAAGTKMDPTVMDAIKHYPIDKFIDDMCDERLRFMHAIRGGSAWSEFGGGWGRRVADLRAYSHSVVKNVPAPVAPDLSNVPTPKAIHTAAPSTTKSNTGKAGATIGAAATAHSMGTPALYIAAGVGVAIAVGIGWEFWKTHAANAANEVVHV